MANNNKQSAKSGVTPTRQRYTEEEIVSRGRSDRHRDKLLELPVAMRQQMNGATWQNLLLPIVLRHCLVRFVDSEKRVRAQLYYELLEVNALFKIHGC